jgi:type III secretion protein T
MRSPQDVKTPWSVFALLVLAVGRIAPIIAFSPFFGARVLSSPVKIVMSVCFSAVILPKLIFTTSTPLSFNPELVILMFREILLGTIFGFFLGLPFLMASAAGVLIDHQRGAASLMVNDPTIQNQSSPLGNLYNFLLIAIFWSVDGPFSVLETLYHSYDLIPPDLWIAPSFLVEKSQLHERIINVLCVFATISLQLAMPALLSVLMTDTFLGIINRLAPQVQITFLGMGLKSWLAIVIVCLGFFPFVTHLTKQVTAWLREFHEIVYEARYPELADKNKVALRSTKRRIEFCEPSRISCSGFRISLHS